MPEIRFRIKDEDLRTLSDRAGKLKLRPSDYARSLTLMKLEEELRSNQSERTSSTRSTDPVI